MAEVYIVDIDGEQWDIKDNILTARFEQLLQKIEMQRKYSTNEVDTGKEWIDGKPIYRRVIYYWLNGAVAPGITRSGSTYSGDAVPQNVENIIIDYMISYRSSGAVDIITSEGAGGSPNVFVPNISDRTAYFANGSYTPIKAYAVFEYTKTTD